MIWYMIWYEGEGASFWTPAVDNWFFWEPPNHKTGSFQSHRQSTEESAIHFTCLACGSLQGSVGT